MSGTPLGHRKLSLRHRIAVNAYLSGMTKTEAMAEAGYSPRYSVGDVFDREDVRAEVERLQQKVMDKYEVSREWVTEQLVRIATAGERLAKFKRVQPDGSLSWDFSGATEEDLALVDSLATDTYVEGRGEGAREVRRFKVGVPGRQAALEAICRVHGLNRDKLELGGELSLVERLQRGRDRVRGPRGEPEDGADPEA